MLALDVERVMRLSPPTPAEVQVGALARSVGRAYLDACRNGLTQLDGALKHAVASLAVRLRTEGAPPERVVVALKHALADVDEDHAIPSLNSDDSDEEERLRLRVYQHALVWCLDAYYGELRPGS